MTKPQATLAFALLTGFSFAQPAFAQRDAADWPMYNRDLRGTRYSPLDEIDTGNVARLELAWRYALGANQTSGGLTGGSEFTPIVVDGVMYVAGADHVAALAADSGAVLWRYELGDTGSPSRRGLTYWPGDSERGPRIFFTSNRRLIGLDAATGETAAGFGDGGIVQMPAWYQGAPLGYGNLLITGSNSPPGGIRAFNAVSGALVWEFVSVPAPGEFGAETWGEGSAAEQTNVFAWAFSLTMDPELGLVYGAFESAGPHDYWGGNRPGDNLFANSIVAIDVATGERRWHFQTVHHDLWDYDLPAPSTLVDVRIDGETVPILAQAAKTGYMYVLNRATGAPVFGIDETAVPPSDVPGERASPTQPIPVKPPPIAKIGFTFDDVVTADDTTEEHAEFCRSLLERSGALEAPEPYPPYVYRAPGAPPVSTVLFPGSVGGANWGGTAADPVLGYIFVNTMDEGSLGWIEENPDDDAPFAYRRNSVVGRTSRFHWAEGSEGGNIAGSGEGAWLCNKPPWGNLLAIDASTGDIAWKVPLGITDALPEGKQRTGRINFGGPIVTGGGLVFIGAANDRRFRAFDSRSGDELWVTRLDMSAHAVPITYLGSDGRQYVAVVAAGASAVDDPSPPEDQALLVFALPRR